MSRNCRVALAGLALTALTLLGTAPSALAQDSGGGPDPTTASAAERTSNEVLPAVVYVETQSESWLRNMTTGELMGPYDLVMSCTGFGVNASGYIATAGHCVSDEDLKDDIDQEVASSQADPEAAYGELAANWKLEGQAAGSSPTKVVSVVRAGQPLDQAHPMTAQIVDSQPNSRTDVALLKVDATDLSTVDVVPSAGVDTGTPITSIGFPGVRDKAVDPSLVPTFKTGTVSSVQQRSGIPFVEISSDMGQGMSGGPTVNAQGRVIGVNSMGVAENAQAFNFVAPSSALLDMMNRNGVRPQPGPSDQAYRSGLAAYYSGHYSEAIADFGRVVDAQPDNRPAADLKAKAGQALARYGDRSSSFEVPLWGWTAGGGVVLLGLVAGLVTILRRRSRREPGSAPQGLQYGPQFDPQYGPQYGADPVPAPGPQDGPAPSGAFAAQIGAQGATSVLTPPEAPPVTDHGQHCPQCGTSMAANARYCRGCGGAML
jgi:serine protease Do